MLQAVRLLPPPVALTAPPPWRHLPRMRQWAAIGSGGSSTGAVGGPAEGVDNPGAGIGSDLPVGGATEVTGAVDDAVSDLGSVVGAPDVEGRAADLPGQLADLGELQRVDLPAFADAQLFSARVIHRNAIPCSSASC